MRSQLAQLQSDVHELAARQQQIDEEIRGLKDALGG
jgi:cell division protein FtsB